MNNLTKQAAVAAGLFALVLATGTAGYAILEGWGLVDSMFMTVITITTVGYGEVHELSTNGRIFTMSLILVSLGSVFYILNTGARVILEGELKHVYEKSRRQKMLRKLKDHYVVCGYGRMGKIITKELKEEGVPFVVIEKSASASSLDEKNIPHIEGDATVDDVLKEAGVERARGLISVLSTDAENLYVVLSARGLNPGLNIVTRAGEEGSERKLIRAGADKVVSPYHIGGLRIAHMVVKPAVVDFIEFATRTGNLDLQMEEIYVEDGSGIAGLSLDKCGVGKELGIIIVAIKDGEGKMNFNPASCSVMNPGDTLIALGEKTKLKSLESMAARG